MICFFPQIISPHDKRIQESILANQVPWVESRDSSVLNVDNPKYIDPLSEVMKEYYGQLKEAALSPAVNAKSTVKFTYTAMHGVGYNYMKGAFRVAGFEVRFFVHFVQCYHQFFSFLQSNSML